MSIWRTLVAFFFSLMSSMTFASAIEWGVTEVYDYGYGAVEVAWPIQGFVPEYDSIANAYHITIWANGYMEYAYRTALVDKGLRLTREYMEQADYLTHATITPSGEPDGTWYDGVFDLAVGETKYIAYTTDFFSGGNDVGWFALTVDENGVFSSPSSARGWGSDVELIVGAIPEPSSVVLLMLGLGLLGLRRKTK